MTQRPTDWLRVAHRGLTLVRSLRGDLELEEDHAAERSRASLLHRTIEDVARQVVGCQRTPACDCPVCRDEKD